MMKMKMFIEMQNLIFFRAGRKVLGFIQWLVSKSDGSVEIMGINLVGSSIAEIVEEVKCKTVSDGGLP